MRKRKKIFFITTKAEIGGAQSHVNLLMCQLHNLYEFILCSGVSGPLSQGSKDMGVKVYIVPQLTNKLFFPALIAIYRLIKEEQPDIIHTHSAIASFIGRIAGRLAGVKTLYTVHGWHFVPNSVWKRRVFGWLLELLARPFTSAWIAVSNYDLKLGVNSGVMDRSRTCVIPNGVEDVEVNYKKRDHDSIKLVFVGRASFQKNCLEAIDILEYCDERVTLTMYVTSGDHLHALKERIENSEMRHKVSLIADDPTAAGALHSYDVMLLTSRYEGMPLCVLEAMRAGLAVVVTDVCGMAEVVAHDETGFLYKLNDIEQAAKKVNQLIEPQIRQKFQVAARKEFKESFRAEIMAKRTAEIYEKLLSEA